MSTDYTRAACRNVDPELFFPVGTSGPAVQQTTDAKAVCLACPIRSACLADNLNVADGIVGGLDETERRDLRQANARRTRVAAQRETQVSA